MTIGFRYNGGGDDHNGGYDDEVGDDCGGFDYDGDGDYDNDCILIVCRYQRMFPC